MALVNSLTTALGLSTHVPRTISWFAGRSRRGWGMSTTSPKAKKVSCYRGSARGSIFGSHGTPVIRWRMPGTFWTWRPGWVFKVFPTPPEIIVITCIHWPYLERACQKLPQTFKRSLVCHSCKVQFVGSMTKTQISTGHKLPELLAWSGQLLGTWKTEERLTCAYVIMSL